MASSISRQKLIKKFKKLGFKGPYAGGRHLFMSKQDLKVHIPNPHGKDISGPLVAEILRQADITLKEWDRA